MCCQNKWIFSIACGITGAQGGFFAKMSLEPKNFIYKDLSFIPYGIVFEWTLRIIFMILCIWTNIKMIEYKIRSFAAIGSSLTVIIAFFVNYIISLICDIFLTGKYPNGYTYQGSAFVLSGIVILMRGAKSLNRTSFYSQGNLDELNLDNVHMYDDAGESGLNSAIEYRRVEQQRLLNMNSSNSRFASFEQNNNEINPSSYKM